MEVERAGMLSDAERERYGRVAAEAYFNGVAPFATELWDAFNDIDTREWFLRSAEAVITAYAQDQQARQAAMAAWEQEREGATRR